MSRLTPIRTGEEVRVRSCAVGSGLLLLLLLGPVLLASSGCAHTYIPGSPSTSYWGQRLEDMMDMGDFGLTLSIKPGIALYKGFPPILTIGYGHVDGLFVGLGGGKLGIMPYHQRSVGTLIAGEEAVGFGDFDVSDPETVDFARTGLMGCAEGPAPGPDRIFSCVHYLHFGFVGVVASARWYQIIDFALGFLGADIGFDDGVEIGRWPAGMDAGFEDSWDDFD